MAETADPATAFLVVACVPREGTHTSGDLVQAEELLRQNPAIASDSILTAAVLGDAAGVRRFLSADASVATTRGGPHDWDPLTYLCFSKYLRLDRARARGFLESAEALLKAGASARTGFFSPGHQPQPEFESVLYGAVGVAHDADLTRLLLEHGADPNDGEVTYHAPEGWDNAAFKVLVESGKLTPDSLATMLLRKTDWHDYEGIKLLLAHGADPNRLTPWGKTALHNALLSDNALPIIEILLEHGADPRVTGTHPEVFRSAAGRSAFSLAAWRGRGDVLNLFERKGIRVELDGVERLLAACAQNNGSAVQEIVAREPESVNALRADGGRALAAFAGNGNTDGVRQLLELGVDVGALDEEGDPYFDIARNSTALHVAAWRARHEALELLLADGAPVDARDGKGHTPLHLAVRACVDSYWTERRSPRSVRALLAAGASVAGVPFPSGYVEVDELLQRHGAVPNPQ